MPSQLEFEIQQHVIKYLDNEESLAEFENWFVPLLWDLDGEDEHARQLAGKVHLLISEFSRGDRSEEDLRASFAEVASQPLTRDSAV
jgi:hypothetical protein